MYGKTTETYSARIVNDGEVGFVLQLPWLLKFGVSSLFLEHLVDESLIGSFGEPAFFIQQSQDARWIILRRRQSVTFHTSQGCQNVRSSLNDHDTNL